MKCWKLYQRIFYGLIIVFSSLALVGCNADLCFIGCQKNSDANAQPVPPPPEDEPDNVFIPRGSFTARYSNSDIGGGTNNIVQRAIGIRVTRNQRNLGDLFLSFSFFPIDLANLSPQQEIGRAVLSILIPEEDIVQDQDIQITRTRPSNFEPSATYTEEGDTPFTANTVNGIIRVQIVEENNQVTISGTFQDFTFTSGGSTRILTGGSFSAFVDLNPAEEGFQFTESRE